MPSKYATGRATSARYKPHGRVSLEVECLRDGTLDVDLETGEAFSVRKGVRTKRRLRTDEDGYKMFYLNRERSDKRGGKEYCRRKKGFRYRRRRGVFVHRIVKIKAIAIAKGGDQNWRQYVEDLPRGVDVNHWDRNRANNRAGNLELQTELANRSRRAMTQAELESVRQFMES